MGNLQLSIRYRPVRIGLCVRQDNWSDLRHLLTVSHTLWGGRFNPLIPIDTAQEFIEAFQVDCLLASCEDDEFKALGEAFPYLDWPGLVPGLYRKISEEKSVCNFIDVYHPARQLYKEHVKNIAHPTIKPAYFEWDEADPLADIFLATFGAYASKDELKIDYNGIFSKLKSESIVIRPDDVLRSDLWNLLTPCEVSSYNLYCPDRPIPGIYYGSATDFVDVMNFWNLRAQDADIFFYDPEHESRLLPFVNSFLADLRKQISPESSRPSIAIYIAQPRSQDGHLLLPDDFNFGNDVMRRVYKTPSRSDRRIVPMHFKDHSLALPIDQTGVKPSVTFQLPPNPSLMMFLWKCALKPTLCLYRRLGGCPSKRSGHFNYLIFQH
jgi:hypothetical protein